MNGVMTMRSFKRMRGLAVEFCERCNSVCTAACRRDAILVRSREKALASGGRFL